MYPRVAADFHVPLVPFLLDGVAGRPELNFPDGLHPTAGGHERLAENVRPQLELLLAEVARDGR
jgi:acyl-CoA thioesterase-1